VIDRGDPEYIPAAVNDHKGQTGKSGSRKNSIRSHGPTMLNVEDGDGPHSGNSFVRHKDIALFIMIENNIYVEFQ
jgi:hypothetical protein